MNWLHRYLDKPSTVGLRRWLVQVHLWAGLVVGLVISALGVSGSAIVFRNEMYRAANRGLVTVTPSGERLPLERQAQSVLAANLGAHIQFVDLPQRPEDASRFYLRFSPPRDGRDENVYVNPYTAEVLGAHPKNLRWLDWISNFHRNLLAGRRGRLADGFVSIVLLILCITGVVVWWPGRAHWKRHLTIRTKLRGWQLAFDLHKVAGFWTVALLLIFAVTGISFTWNVSKFVYWITHTTPVKRERLEPKWKIGDPLLPLDVYLEKLPEVVPGAQAVFLDLPVERGNLVEVSFRLPSDFRREGAESVLLLDPATASVLRLDLLRGEPLGEKILASFGALHFGEFGFGPIGDTPTKIAWVVLGFVPGTLFVTGLWPWWTRVRRKYEAGRSVNG